MNRKNFIKSLTIFSLSLPFFSFKKKEYPKIGYLQASMLEEIGTRNEDWRVYDLNGKTIYYVFAIDDICGYVDIIDPIQFKQHNKIVLKRVYGNFRLKYIGNNPQYQRFC